MHLLITMLSTILFTSNATTVDDFTNAKSPKSLIFISAVCPCSNAHIEHIKEITEAHPGIKNFYVATESKITPEHLSYYKKIGVDPIIDEKQTLVKKYKALKTPHSVILNDKGAVVYEGGVTNKKDPDSANILYFKEASASVSNNETPQITKERSLGCYIKRI